MTGRELSREEPPKVRRPIYQLKVTLERAEPPVWRRLLVSGNRSMKTLHQTLQIAMGWTNSHLHLFEFPDGSVFTDLEFMLDDIEHDDEASTKLRKLVKTPGSTFKYEYDFGDSWSHSIELEDILVDEGWEPRCIAGEGAGPPEDVGGVRGYSEFLAAMADPKHQRHDELKRWIGNEWQPEFDMEATNEALRSLKPW